MPGAHAEPLHGLIQKARNDASDYSIKPGLRWGFLVRKKRKDGQWQALAHLKDEAAAEDYACEKLARLTE